VLLRHNVDVAYISTVMAALPAKRSEIVDRKLGFYEFQFLQIHEFHTIFENAH